MGDMMGKRGVGQFLERGSGFLEIAIINFALRLSLWFMTYVLWLILVFSCEYWDIFKNSFFYRTLPVAVSVTTSDKT